MEEEVPRLVLVNPAHVKALAGRKTDRIDSRRLARYLENQDLEGSFVPPREVRELRDRRRPSQNGGVNKCEHCGQPL